MAAKYDDLAEQVEGLIVEGEIEIKKLISLLSQMEAAGAKVVEFDAGYNNISVEVR